MRKKEIAGRLNVEFIEIGKIDLNAQLENLIIDFSDSNSVDIGAILYRDRESENKRGVKRGSVVTLSSLEKKRYPAVKRLLGHIQDRFTLRMEGNYTLFQKLSEFVAFMNWSDKNGHTKALISLGAAEKALLAYQAHRLEHYHSDEIGLRTYTTVLRLVSALLCRALDVEYVVKNFMTARTRWSYKETIAPKASDQGNVLAVCEMVFTGIAKFCLEGLLYPHKLELPGFLGWPGNSAWLMPSRTGFVAPSLAAPKDNQLFAYPRAFNYFEGRIANEAEIRASYSIREMNASNVRAKTRQAQLQFDLANKDKRHIWRMFLAMSACDAFLVLFVAATGMNWTQVRNLKWTRSDFKRADKQGFHEVKARARNKPVSFYLSNQYLQFFKLYLKLRKFILGRDKSPYLFLCIEREIVGRRKFRKIHGCHLNYIFKRLAAQFGGAIPKILTRQWRASKFNHLQKTVDFATAAKILQTSKETAASHYATGTEDEHREEMTSFLARMRQVLKRRRKPSQSDSAAPLGDCGSYGNPALAKSVGNPTIAPDCKQEEGCLDCKYYSVHADEKDVRKLLSYKFCIEQTRHLSPTPEKFSELFGVTLQRISAIVTEISHQSTDHERLTARIEEEIRVTGALDPYWAKKYDMLIDLNIATD
ncbi:hypothetical protein J8I26_12210 [Herbaspirillum sp. LeCh32-8]|uniref:hypothetical protein n=1 Tax=Herbaspirillum sp. LeCh32-8 TaxID=2821356 RepID=UPI001AEAB51B|nr:hypothetical protein [Herbaspirillum sp. LeCh32-8]MBP0598875.1 hypothetical protein [Herbaspirillum sp. LeCh32-8]